MKSPPAPSAWTLYDIKMMKLNILILLALTNIELKGQLEDHYNYNPFIIYDNQLVDKIINFERHINSSFLLRGEIKSVHFIDSSVDSEKQTSIKYHYNISKHNIGITNYDEYQNEVGERKFLSKPYYDGYQILMDGYAKQINSSQLIWNSSIDSINKIIKIKTITNGELTTLDSVLYIDQFTPVKIFNKEKHSGLWQNKSIQFHEYENDKVITSLKLYSATGKWGAKRFYDGYGRPLYYQALIDIDKNTLQYNLDSIKNEVFTWNNGDFIYSNNNFTTSYDSTSKTIIRKLNDANTKIKLSRTFKPIKVEIEYFDNLEEKVEIVYFYNKYDDCIDKKYLNQGGSGTNEHFEFVYDEKGNWIEKKNTMMANGLVQRKEK
ncbi:MAG: hypothetical protein IPO37_02510 [Saprospiraceae bacterium]|nr:hypothetical protein [Saprospiraceae bacterium]